MKALPLKTIWFCYNKANKYTKESLKFIQLLSVREQSDKLSKFLKLEKIW